MKDRAIVEITINHNGEKYGLGLNYNDILKKNKPNKELFDRCFALLTASCVETMNEIGIFGENKTLKQTKDKKTN